MILIVPEILFSRKLHLTIHLSDVHLWPGASLNRWINVFVWTISSDLLVDCLRVNGYKQMTRADTLLCYNYWWCCWLEMEVVLVTIQQVLLVVLHNLYSYSNTCWWFLAFLFVCLSHSYHLWNTLIYHCVKQSCCTFHNWWIYMQLDVSLDLPLLKCHRPHFTQQAVR